MSTHTSPETSNDYLFDSMGRYRRERFVAPETEVPFLEAVATMTDAELAGYRARYAKATDNISMMHGNAVRAEIARRVKAATSPQQTAAEMLPERGAWSTPAEDYAHGVAIRSKLLTARDSYYRGRRCTAADADDALDKFIAKYCPHNWQTACELCSAWQNGFDRQLDQWRHEHVKSCPAGYAGNHTQCEV